MSEYQLAVSLTTVLFTCNVDLLQVNNNILDLTLSGNCFGCTVLFIFVCLFVCVFVVVHIVYIVNMVHI